jgi:hypothetical protein
MKLRITYFPKCEWREDAKRLGEEVKRELCIEFEYKEKDIRDGGVSPAFFLDGIELFPVKISGAGCLRQLPSKDELVEEIRLKMKNVGCED